MLKALCVILNLESTVVSDHSHLKVTVSMTVKPSKYSMIMNKFLSVRALPLLLSLLVPCATSLGESLTDLIKQGDVHDQKFAATEALKYYQQAEKTEADNVDLLLRIARQYRHLMQDESNLSEKLKLGAIAKDYAVRAASLAPKESEAHLSIAISHAKMVPFLGNKERMESSRQIKIEVDKAIALNSKSDLAWHILGCWHQKLADIGALKRTLASMVYDGLPTAKNEDAVKCFEKAIALNPNRLINYIELGRTYAQMGDDTKAREYIDKGLLMPNVGKDDPASKATGRKTLSALK